MKCKIRKSILDDNLSVPVLKNVQGKWKEEFLREDKSFDLISDNWISDDILDHEYNIMFKDKNNRYKGISIDFDFIDIPLNERLYSTFWEGSNAEDHCINDIHTINEFFDGEEDCFMSKLKVLEIGQCCVSVEEYNETIFFTRIK